MTLLGEIEESHIPIPDCFRGFNPYDEVRVYTRNLPHWRQPGASYFVTFRTADSIPESIWREMSEEAKEWREVIQEALDRHAGKVPESVTADYEKFQRRYQGRLEKLLDGCSGRCPFQEQSSREIVADSLKHFQGKRYDLYAAVIMPNHCHCVFRPLDAFEPEEIIGSWKSYTSRRIENSDEALWQAESFDRIIRDESHFRKSVRYVLRNPPKANLSEGEFWLWSTGVKHPFIENPADEES